jgi:tRNA-2-methylthio-N6-dimethylallyladenosine synthase
MRGCDNFCAYCVVPYARGPEVCRPIDDVLREVEELVGAGFKDITLIGQNVNSYRHGGTSFAELLLKADALCDGVFLRFTTNHPRDVNDETVAALGRCRNVARHLHLPLQSGSDAVLRAMNRDYDVSRYLDVVSKVRKAVPGICLTTDILVGFPGETEDDFEATLGVVERVRYDSAYVFMYSPRAGTAAAALADDVPRPEKVRRLQTVGARQRAIALEINEGMVGSEHRALVEGPSRKKAGEYAGRLSENKIVNFAGRARPGEFVRLKITEASSWTLRGELAP